MDRLWRENEQLKAELAAEREQIAMHLKAREADTRDIRRLVKERDKLREALEPFARAYDDMTRSLGYTNDTGVYGVYVGDLRRARALLKETGDKP
jgi:septal ring factor EnvC (AmiA/AmiB activator)